MTGTSFDNQVGMVAGFSYAAPLKKHWWREAAHYIDGESGGGAGGVGRGCGRGLGGIGGGV